MATDSRANVAQFQVTKDLKIDANQELAPTKITGTDGGTTTLTAQQLVVEVVPPASGTHTITLPPLDQWKGKQALFYSRTSAPGGQVAVRLTENATDPVGDNLTASADKVLLQNVNGDHVVLLIDVTT